jgi:hypothetical protein
LSCTEGNSADEKKRGRVYSAVALLPTLCMLAATVLVMRGDFPPVFNQSPKQYGMLNIAILVGLLTATAVFSIHAGFGKLSRLAEVLKIVFVAALTVNVLFGLLEKFVVGIDGAKLIRNFRNVTVNGVRLPLQQSNQFSEFGFRIGRVESKAAPVFRYLMLGNSYTKGSGSSLETNYPQVVEEALNNETNKTTVKASIFAAGVDGYGLEEDGRLYDLLTQNGYKFDAVVLNIMMGSDLTNDIPGTIRLATAGEPQRFHKDPFLFYVYPLNSSFFRYMLYFKITAGNEAVAPAPPPAKNEEAIGGACTNSPGYAQFVRDRALQYYGPDASKRIFLEYNLRFADEIISRADTAGLKVYVVLQPDPNAELDSRRQMLPPGPMMWDWTREAVKHHFPARIPVLDLGPYFRNRDDLFRCSDTHWNDAGNIAAGEIVGRWLTERTSNGISRK